MPHYRFTFLMASIIVLGYGLALLWPDEQAHVWGWRAMVCLPLLLAIFMWTAVRGAPPLDDRAFHRTLPPGDGVAFRQVLGMAMVVPVCVAVLVAIYCWKFNFGWRPLSFGVAVLTVPLVGGVAVLGLVSSLATSRSYTRVWPWLMFFAAPMFSALAMNWLTEKLDPETHRSVYFTHWRTMALAGALLYPLMWWLVAARRRLVLGGAMAFALGVLMPWLYHYGDLGPEREFERRDSRQIPPLTRITVVRKEIPAVPEWKGKIIDMDQLIGIEGLEKDEFLVGGFMSSGNSSADPNRLYFRTSEVVGREEGSRKWKYGYISGGISEMGTVALGRGVVWDSLRRKIPAGMSLGCWDADLDGPTRLGILAPGEVLEGEELLSYGGRNRRTEARTIREESLRNTQWNFYGSVVKFGNAGIFPIDRGGSEKMAGGGLLRVDPLKWEDGHAIVGINCYQEDLWQADGPWPGEDQNRSIADSPWGIVVDETERQAYMIDDFRWSGERNAMLGYKYRLKFDAGQADSPERKKRLERLPHCKLYLFTPKLSGWVRQEMPAK